jgi:hypothetical protein
MCRRVISDLGGSIWDVELPVCNINGASLVREMLCAIADLGLCVNIL